VSIKTSKGIEQTKKIMYDRCIGIRNMAEQQGSIFFWFHPGSLPDISFLTEYPITDKGFWFARLKQTVVATSCLKNQILFSTFKL